MADAAATCSRDFTAVLSAGDLEGAAACFTREGCLVTPDGTALHGRDQIKQVLAQMVIRRTEIEVELSDAITAGDVMLVRERWRVEAGEGAARLEQVLHPTLVLRHVEGTWKLAIAMPWKQRGP
jgi:uncharacterized protein (TIGR02246 family)